MTNKEERREEGMQYHGRTQWEEKGSRMMSDAILDLLSVYFNDTIQRHILNLQTSIMTSKCASQTTSKNQKPALEEVGIGLYFVISSGAWLPHLSTARA
jgi:hypothetical protein